MVGALEERVGRTGGHLEAAARAAARMQVIAMGCGDCDCDAAAMLVMVIMLMATVMVTGCSCSAWPAWLQEGIEQLVARRKAPSTTEKSAALTAEEKAGLDEGLPSFSLSNIVYTENPHGYKKYQ
jgi:hypothetical protein